MFSVLVMFGSFLVILFLGVPIGMSMGFASIIGVFVTGSSHAFFQTITQKMFTGIDSFALMAVPFFLLAGNFMSMGGISKRLVGFFKLVIRRVPAATAIINSVASAFFGALTGSIPATTAAIGGITIPLMEKEGYPKGDACAIAAAGGILGPIIPPSISMITYGVTASVSISTMFLCGIIPGILMAVGYVIVELIKYRKIEPAHRGKLEKGALGKAFVSAIPALGMPVIILGGIYGGIFTPTEAAAISCIYALIVSGLVYRELPFKNLFKLFRNAAVNTAQILFILCMAASYAWMMTQFGLIKTIADLLLNIGNKYLILLVVNVILLILGCFIDATSIIIIVTPILLPVADVLGISYIGLGIMICVNVACGALTPPLAPSIFVACNVGGTRSIGPACKAVLPFLGTNMIVLALITYIPDVVLWLPRLLGAVIR